MSSPARRSPRPQLQAEAASESPGVLTPRPCRDPVYPPFPPSVPWPRSFSPGSGRGAQAPFGGGDVGDRWAAGRAQGGRLVGLHPTLFPGSAMTVESPFGILSIWQCHGAGEDLWTLGTGTTPC